VYVLDRDRLKVATKRTRLSDIREGFRKEAVIDGIVMENIKI